VDRNELNGGFSDKSNNSINHTEVSPVGLQQLHQRWRGLLGGTAGVHGGLSGTNNRAVLPLYNGSHGGVSGDYMTQMNGGFSETIERWCHCYEPKVWYYRQHHRSEISKRRDAG
jgi:hypothetical protein